MSTCLILGAKNQTPGSTHFNRTYKHMINQHEPIHKISEIQTNLKQ